MNLRQTKHLFPDIYSLLARWTALEAAALLTWFLTMTAVPIAIWTIGAESIPFTMLIATVAQALAVFLLLTRSWGLSRAIMTGAGVFVLGWAVEWLGSTTGFPFGSYYYTNLLQPQLVHVPLLVPLAWFMMLPVAWGVAQIVTGRHSGWRFVLTAAAAMTAWDFFLDPQMVGWGFWVWETVAVPTYFGIPWLNYAGWFLSSAVMTALLQPLSLKRVFTPLLTIYAIIWLMQTGGLLLFWGLPGPAAVGFGVMGTFVVWAVKKRV